MLIQYREHRFAKKSLQLIDKANEILADFESQGYQLTLRQLYYQFIGIDYFPNSEKSYDRLGEVISNARIAGLVDWNHIEDRTRNLRGRDSWDTSLEFVKDAQGWYHLDMWENQPNYVEVWVEKDALIGVLSRPCNELDVPFMSCRGYMSQSEEWAAANRFEEAYFNGKNPVLIYLGDHDPSGMDMSRDHISRMEMFLEQQGVGVDVRRIAMNIDQVMQYKPPENPTKPKDSRTEGYVKKFGKKCWELDALKPKVIDDLIRKEIDTLRDMTLWNERLTLLRQKRDEVQEIFAAGVRSFNKVREGRSQEG